MKYSVYSFWSLFLGLLLLPFPIRFFLWHEGLWSLSYSGLFLALPTLFFLLAGFFLACSAPSSLGKSFSPYTGTLFIVFGIFFAAFAIFVPYPLTFLFFLFLLFQGTLLTWLFFSFRERLPLLFLSLLFGAVIQLFLIFLQVLFQHVSLPFFGALITPLTPEVAKVQVQGISYLRGYGSFLHPNILGAYLSLVFLLMLFFLRQTWMKYAWGALLGVGILLTGSKAALLFVALTLLLFARPRFLLGVVFSLLALFFLPSVLGLYGTGFFWERFTVLWTLLPGVLLSPLGYGPFTAVPLYDYFSFGLLRPWEIIPVHNVFFLLLVEYGAIFTLGVLLCFGFGISRLFHYTLPRKRVYFWAFLLYLFVFGSLDHYFLTSFPGFFFPLLLVGFLFPTLLQSNE